MKKVGGFILGLGCGDSKWRGEDELKREAGRLVVVIKGVCGDGDD